MDKNYDIIKLENQICFPLYAASKEIIKNYKEYLESIDLTYTQYITMMVLWENKEINVKELGKCLYLDSGTLTPVLKKLEQKGYISRERDKSDERSLLIKLTKNGDSIKDEALIVPEKMMKLNKLTVDEMKELYKLLYKILGK